MAPVDTCQEAYFCTFLLQGEIGPRAVAMITELIMDNGAALDRLTKDHVDHFVRLVKERKVVLRY